MAIIMTILTVLAACNTPGKDASNLPEGAVAVVNDTIISQDEFDKMVALQKLSYEAQLGAGVLNEVVDGITLLDLLKANILEQMVMDEIIIQEALKQDFEVTEDEVESNYETFVEMLGEDTEFLETLEQNGLDEQFIKDIIIRKSLITEYYANDYFYSIEISEEQAFEFYEVNLEQYREEQLRASHILVSDYDLAEELLERIKSGEEFADLAKEYGEDGTSEAGGDLGYFGRGSMVPEFEEPVFNLEVGEVSDIIESRFGYHLVVLEDKIVEEDSFEEIMDFVKDDLRSIEFEKHLEELWENADITKNTNL